MSTETTSDFAHEPSDEELASVHGGMMKHIGAPTIPYCWHDDWYGGGYCWRH